MALWITFHLRSVSAFTYEGRVFYVFITELRRALR
jgi:hypothetical protein